MFDNLFQEVTIIYTDTECAIFWDALFQAEDKF